MYTGANRMDANRPLILVVEDEPPILKLIGMILSDAGYPMLSAGNGCEALETCRSAAGTIDLLITDIQLTPHMDGLSVAGAIRSIHPDIRVLYISGFNSIFDRVQEEVDHQRTWFLQKPFSPKELADTVKMAFLKDHRAESTGSAIL
jgi:CheY-like chemotaxis protein